MEVMRSERIVEAEISPDTAAVALTDTFELVKLQRKAERISILKIAGCIAAVSYTHLDVYKRQLRCRTDYEAGRSQHL